MRGGAIAALAAATAAVAIGLLLPTHEPLADDIIVLFNSQTNTYASNACILDGNIEHAFGRERAASVALGDARRGDGLPDRVCLEAGGFTEKRAPLIIRYMQAKIHNHQF